MNIGYRPLKTYIRFSPFRHKQQTMREILSVVNRSCCLSTISHSVGQVFSSNSNLLMAFNWCRNRPMEVFENDVDPSTTSRLRLIWRSKRTPCVFQTIPSRSGNGIHQLLTLAYSACKEASIQGPSLTFMNVISTVHH